MTQVSMTNLGVWSSTKAKLDRIAELRRWSLVTTLDILADEYLAKVEASREPALTPPAASENRPGNFDPVTQPASQQSVADRSKRSAPAKSKRDRAARVAR